MSTRKRLQKKDIQSLRKLLLDGSTSNEAAREMGVSIATVSNYRAYFKKKGDVFPNNRGRKPKIMAVKDNSSRQIIKSDHQFSNTYKYNINGLQVTFSDKPKTLRIGKMGMAVEF